MKRRAGLALFAFLLIALSLAGFSVITITRPAEAQASTFFDIFYECSNNGVDFSPPSSMVACNAQTPSQSLATFSATYSGPKQTIMTAAMYDIKVFGTGRAAFYIGVMDETAGTGLAGGTGSEFNLVGTDCSTAQAIMGQVSANSGAMVNSGDALIMQIDFTFTVPGSATLCSGGTDPGGMHLEATPGTATTTTSSTSTSSSTSSSSTSSPSTMSSTTSTTQILRTATSSGTSLSSSSSTTSATSSSTSGVSTRTGMEFPWWLILLIILILLLIALYLLWRFGVLPVGEPGEGKPSAPDEKPPETPKTQGKPPEEPKPPTEPPKQPGTTPVNLATPCLCPCPTGVGLHVELRIDPGGILPSFHIHEEDFAMGVTKGTPKVSEGKIKVPYDFKKKDLIGWGNAEKVIIVYRCVVWYANPPGPKCCDMGKLGFDGTAILDGSYTEDGKRVAVKNATAKLEASGEFDNCDSDAVPQCRIKFSQNMDFVFPPGKDFYTFATKLPGVKSWNEGSVTVEVKGTLTIEITTKKES